MLGTQDFTGSEHWAPYKFSLAIVFDTRQWPREHAVKEIE